MRKILCLVCAVAMMVSVLGVSAIAADVQGLVFDDNSKYEVIKPFEAAPVSLEAWVCLPKDVGRAGVIFGNYGGSTPCVNFEITTGGRPRVYVVEYTSGEKKINDVVFDGVDIRTGKMEHLALVYDADAEMVYCYVNGELKASKTCALNITEEVCAQPYALGGDLRSGNGQYFKGGIDIVAVYSDVRTVDEIQASMSQVDLMDENLIAYYDTLWLKNDMLGDMSGNGNSVKRTVKWLAEKDPVVDYAYSFCVVGDTQKITINEPEKLSCIYDWIVENKDEKRIEFVFGMGDITDKSTDEEWTIAKEQIFKLNGVVPYSLVRGNHDGSAKMNEYFAVSDYTSMLGGVYQSGKIDNAWSEFRVGEVDYLVLMLDYGASDAVLNWAAGVIEAHPNHKVIITTHCYLYNDGTTLDAGDVCPPNTTGANDGVKNNGDQMWDKLVSKYENIFLVLSGHDPSENVVATQTEGVHGNVVTQFLVDPQGLDAALGATGMVAMLYFSEDGKTLTVEQYSTVKDMYYMNTSQFTLPLPVKEEEISTVPETEEKTESAEPDESTPVLPDDEQSNTDIGIIGGADGPTTILVTGQIWPLIAVGILVVVVISAAVGFFLGRKMRKYKKS